jgi:6-phosphogluconolactonase
MTRPGPDFRVRPNLDVLSREVARAIQRRVEESLAVQEQCAVVLAGGQTPRRLYAELAGVYRDSLPWPRVHVFLSDERYVPWDDPRSNYRLVRESLLDHVPIPAGNVHPMRTDLPNAGDAALAHERVLRAFFPDGRPRFDLMLLGMGADGHTASLFPGSAALREQARWVLAVLGPAEPRLRLTLTLPVLNGAAEVFFLVAGSEKAPALGQVLAGPPGADYPAAAVRPEGGRAVWWIDEAAAAFLGGSRGVDKP